MAADRLIQRPRHPRPARPVGARTSDRPAGPWDAAGGRRSGRGELAGRRGARGTRPRCRGGRGADSPRVLPGGLAGRGRGGDPCRGRARHRRGSPGGRAAPPGYPDPRRHARPDAARWASLVGVPAGRGPRARSAAGTAGGAARIRRALEQRRVGDPRGDRIGRGGCRGGAGPRACARVRRGARRRARRSRVVARAARPDGRGRGGGRPGGSSRPARLRHHAHDGRPARRPRGDPRRHRDLPAPGRRLAGRGARDPGGRGARGRRRAGTGQLAPRCPNASVHGPADGAAEPALLRGVRGAARPWPPRGGRDRHPDGGRGSVQGRQRPVRPRGRGRRASGDRPDDRRRPCATSTCRPASAARSS